MPSSARCAASARTTGVLPDPPTTTLPMHITSTAGTYGRASERRIEAAAVKAAPAGESNPAMIPGGAFQNSGARIDPERSGAGKGCLGFFCTWQRHKKHQRIEQWREPLEYGRQHAVT